METGEEDKAEDIESAPRLKLEDKIIGIVFNDEFEALDKQKCAGLECRDLRGHIQQFNELYVAVAI